MKAPRGNANLLRISLNKTRDTLSLKPVTLVLMTEYSQGYFLIFSSLEIVGLHVSSITGFMTQHFSRLEILP